MRDFAELARRQGVSASPSGRPVVCVQGLGFVGLAMALAVALARDADGLPVYDVAGIDLPTPEGQAKAAAINAGQLPVSSADASMREALDTCRAAGNLVAATDPEAFCLADVALVDVNLDLRVGEAGISVPIPGFVAAVRDLGTRLRPGALVVVESTVPPGTCARVVAPELDRCCAERGLPPGSLLLAHAYERVMPGKDYLDSVRNFWRVYAGHTPQAAEACGAFLSRVVNVRDFPLRRLHSTTASETAKVLENSYRAVNIAFIEEWGRFAEAVGVDLFEVIEAIRVRPTHRDIRQPGLGVGGYCLTKDPLFAKWAATELFDRPDLEFPFSERAVAVNEAMPLGAVRLVERGLGGLKGRRLLLLGVSYRQDVDDTRCSPSETFAREVTALGARLAVHDPLVRRWREMERDVEAALPPAGDFDAVVFAVPHGFYRTLDMAAWLGKAGPLVVDANNVLDQGQREAARRAGCRVLSIGRGEP